MLTLWKVLLEKGARKNKIQCLGMQTFLGSKNTKSEEVITSKTKCLMLGSLEIYSDGVLYAADLLESALKKNTWKDVGEARLDRGSS